MSNRDDVDGPPTDRIRVVIGSGRRARAPRNLREKATRVAVCPYCKGGKVGDAVHPSNKDCAGTGVETNWS